MPPECKNVEMSSILESHSLSSSEVVLLDWYDKHVYLARLHSLAERMMDGFTMEMEECVSFVGCGNLRVAPVKKMDRAIEKIGTDYHDERKYPKSARILDLIRCSVVFDRW